MEQTIAVQIPRQWLEDVPEREATLQQLFKLGLDQYKVERALALYQDGAGSLGYIAEQLGLSKRKLVQEARLRGIEPDFSEETVREDMSFYFKYNHRYYLVGFWVDVDDDYDYNKGLLQDTLDSMKFN